ncbi:hypothetical protein BDV34DRAFT_202881 [Aspergillus parasiticus]|uniref:Uncharacterized protein n=1 Tax=Aspergillus parasiticus TaxID=5067 RepID=A0A5N6DAQ0_ASPPA|nr:hypothetical protein BDV34DRAFT_202881 [Aspergillus parasiticus]
MYPLAYAPCLTGRTFSVLHAVPTQHHTRRSVGLYHPTRNGERLVGEAANCDRKQYISDRVPETSFSTTGTSARGCRSTKF